MPLFVNATNGRPNRNRRPFLIVAGVCDPGVAGRVQRRAFRPHRGRLQKSPTNLGLVYY